MNTKLALSAIALFAVTLGMGLFPAAMAKADTTICHFSETEFLLEDTDGDGIPDTPVLEDTDGDGIPDSPIVVEPAHWMFLTLNNKGAVNGHLKNHGEDTDGDGVIDIPEFLVNDDITTATCQGLIDG